MSVLKQRRNMTARTGVALPAYNFQVGGATWDTLPSVHTDGTIFVVDGGSVVGVDPLSGQSKFTVPIDFGHQAVSNNCTDIPVPTPRYGWVMQETPLIAGDGYYYVIYRRIIESYSASCDKQLDPVSQALNYENDVTDDYSTHELRVLRVASDGSHDDALIRSRNTDYQTHYTYQRFQIGTDTNGNPIYGWQKHNDNARSDSGDFDVVFDHGVLTNADQGIVFARWGGSPSSSTYTHDWDYQGHDTQGGTSSPRSPETTTIITVSGGQLAGEVPLQVNPNDLGGFLQIYLQRADGVFFGNYWGADDRHNNLLAFDSTGNVLWEKPISEGFMPQYALADGSVLYLSAPSASSHDLVTVNGTGTEIGRVVDQAIGYSWRGAYQQGSTKGVAAGVPPPLALSFAAVEGGNLTHGGTSIVHHRLGLLWNDTTNSGDQCGPANNRIQYQYYRYAPQEHQSPSDAVSFAGNPLLVLRLKESAYRAFSNAFPEPVIVQKTADGVEYPICVLDKDPNAGGGFGSVGAAYYFGTMEQAQVATGYAEGQGPNCDETWCDFSPQYSDQTGMLRLTGAIGTAIGRAAAHEVGHYLKALCIEDQRLPVMDCGLGNEGGFGKPERVACDDGNNFVYEFYKGGSGSVQDPTNVNSQGGQFFFTDLPGHIIDWGRQDKAWINKWVFQESKSCK